jgi:ribosome recycling factor
VIITKSEAFTKEELQKLVDEANVKFDSMAASKEKEINS